MNINDKKIDFKARKKARQTAVQALYQYQMANTNKDELMEKYVTANQETRFDSEFFQEILKGALGNLAYIDEHLQPFLDRKLSSLDPIELSILRVGCYEFVFRKDIPPAVIINEAVELAKKFGASDGHKYINGVLDKLKESQQET